MKDAKYLIAFIAPLSVILSLHLAGWWSYSTFYITFIIIPVLELVNRGSSKNLSSEEESVKNDNRFFDWLLYLNVPLIIGLLIYFFYVVSTVSLTTFELAGIFLSTGIMLGYGINVAHELGHRRNPIERSLSMLLLIPSHYMHFIIEHNLGHHKNVSTDVDPSSARLNENIFSFYFRSVVTGYLHAWTIENRRLKSQNKNPIHVANQMIWFAIIQITYLVLVYAIFGQIALIGAVIAGIVGFLLLESVNYIEHYGLRRNQLANGKYEPVQPYHSWNSNHELGRIFLYELTRHSDHHYKSTRKYQVLRHFDESPQLPYGYPASILIAMLPPLWFHMMNPEVKKHQKMNRELRLELAVEN